MLDLIATLLGPVWFEVIHLHQKGTLKKDIMI